MGGELGTVVHGLRRWDGGVGISHVGAGDKATLEHKLGLDPEKGGFEENKVRQLAHLDGPQFVTDAICNGRIDRVLGDVTKSPKVVGGRMVGVFQFTKLLLHFIGSLPSATEHLPHPAHGLTVTGHDRKGPEIVQDIFGGNGLGTNAGFRECNVLGNFGVQMMTHHEHIEMLVDGIDGERTSRIGGRRQNVRFTADSDDVRSMTATGSLGVKSVDGSTLEGGHGILDKAGLVEGIGMNGDLHVHFIGHAETDVYCGGSGAPVLMKLESHGAGSHLLTESLGRR